MQAQPKRQSRLGFCQRARTRLARRVELGFVRHLGFGANTVSRETLPLVGKKPAIPRIPAHLVRRPVQKLDTEPRSMALPFGNSEFQRFGDRENRAGWASPLLPRPET